MLITREKMFPPILEACPSFLPIWEEFIDEWKEDPEGYPYYLVIADLTRHLAKLMDENDIEQIPKVLEIVETWLLEGDNYVKEAATVGFLEDLQKKQHDQISDPNSFYPMLLPESKYWWDKVNLFWQKGVLLVDDRKPS